MRVWDAATGRPRGEPLTGHTGTVNAVAIRRIGDRDVIVSGSSDSTVRVWDAATGRPRGEPLTGHTGAVARAVALGRVGEREAVALCGGLVRYGAALGSGKRRSEQIGQPLTGHTGAAERGGAGARRGA